MEQTMNMTNVSNSIKDLIEVGGMYKVSDDWYITNDEDEQINIVVNGKDHVPLRVIHDPMVTGNYRILNPYTETAAEPQEQLWFFNLLRLQPGCFVKKAIMRVVEHAVSKDDEKINPSCLPYITKYMKKVNKGMLSELRNIPAVDFLFIHYNKKTKTSTIQSKILTGIEDLELKTKTEVFLQSILTDFLGVIEIPGRFKYKATIMALQKLDAVLHVYGMLIEQLIPIFKAVAEINIDIDIIHTHLSHIESYEKVAGWCVSTTPVKEEKKESVPPWRKETSALIIPPLGGTPNLGNTQKRGILASMLPSTGHFVDTSSIPSLPSLPSYNQFQQPIQINPWQPTQTFGQRPWG